MVEYVNSRKQELKGLLYNVTFVPINPYEVPSGKRTFGARFIYNLKRSVESLKRKSRLNAQNYSDEGAYNIATKAQTIKHEEQPLVMSLEAFLDNMTPLTRDVTQAYVQSRS